MCLDFILFASNECVKTIVKSIDIRLFEMLE